MAWQDLGICSCCQGCTYLEGSACRRHTMRLRCDGRCKDFELSPSHLQGVLTEEEQERCRQFAAHPAARFPLLTRDEMRRLLWFHTYFGDREHQPDRPALPHDDALGADVSYPDAA